MDSERHQVKICIVRLCHGSWEHPAIGDWFADAVHFCLTDPRIGPGNLESFWLDEEPVYRARNMAQRRAKELGCDLLVMVDNDMFPDWMPGAPKFLQSALDFWWDNHATGHPCVICAPARVRSGMVAVHKLIEDKGRKGLVLMHPREMQYKAGIERVPGSGLSLSLIDMRVFERLHPPYFRFAYTDEYCTQIRAGEDVMFTADLGGPCIPVYVNWDCKADHSKKVWLGWPKPESRVLMP